ncbi:MAG TPA: HEAT repeat domain-containing protein [Phototrophicaceae bacterium]|nr:HEAT repeat domain-containing protein [Phototrophicaceae bacterium]
MTGHIFISYRNIYEEPQFALRLAAELKNRGIPAWIDKMDIQSGDDWQDALERGVNNCQAMIAVISPDYIQSSYCKDELKRARRLERPIFPVLLREVPAEAWPIQAESIQYVDFRDWQDDTAYRRGVEKLTTTIQEKLTHAAVPIPDAETQYLNRLIAELEARKGVLEYVDLAGRMDEPVRPKPRISEEWGLEGAYALLEMPSTQVALSQGEWLSEREAKKIPLDNIRRAVELHPRFVLIGDPGAGKTTTLRRLALDAARIRLTDSSAPLPLLLYLPQWNEKDSPAEFVKSRMVGEGLKSSYMKNLSLYLDGLNEMGAGGAEKAKKLRDWLADHKSPEHVLATCRTGDYTGDLELLLPTVWAQPMSEDQICQFVENYLGYDADRFLARVLLDPDMPEWIHQQQESRSLFRLATNPYLLTALMVVFKNSPEGELPRNNGALFRKLAMALWERERLRRTPGWIPFNQMEERFGMLAFAMIDEHEPINVLREYALKYLGDESLLRVGSSANLIEIHGYEMRFYHQLMQEYFVAVDFNRRGVSHLWNRLEYVTAWESKKWRQPIISLCGIVSNPTSFLRQLAVKDACGAANCLLSGIKVSSSTREQIVSKLIKSLEHGDWRIREEAVHFLRDLEHVDGLIEALGNEDEEVRWSAVEALGFLKNRSATHDLAQLLLRDKSSDVCCAAAEALGSIGDPTAVPILLEATEHEDTAVSQAAFEAIEEIGDAAIPALLDALQNEEADVETVMELLGEFNDEHEVITITKLTRNENAYVRVAAYDTLEKFEQDVVPDVVEILLKEWNSDSRELAAAALGIIGGTEAVDGLKEALSDWSWFVQRAAAEALERIGTPEALEAVRRWREEQKK